jgi:hypothetical protein
MKSLVLILESKRIVGITELADVNATKLVIKSVSMAMLLNT